MNSTKDPGETPSEHAPSDRWPVDEARAIEDLDRLLRDLAARSTRYSWLRLLTFLVGVIGFLAGLKGPIVPLLVGLPAFIGFAVVVALHGRIQRHQSRISFRRTLLSERLGRKTSRKRERAAPPIDPQSAFALDRGESILGEETDLFAVDDGLSNDLDLFEGPRPLFGFLDVCSTSVGARRLRYILTHPFTRVDAIEKRQAAVRELAERHRIRCRFLEALAPLRKHSYDTIPQFLGSDPQFPTVSTPAILSNVLGTIAPILVLLSLFVNPVYLFWLILIVPVNLGIIGVFLKRLTVARDRVLLFGPLLDALHDLDTEFTGWDGSSPRLVAVRDALVAQRPVNRGIRRYIRLLEMHGYGALFEVINVLTLWELRFVPLAERLLHRHRHVLEQAIGGLAELEALISLAGPLAEHASFTLPTPLDREKPGIEAEALGHPLIEDDRVVRNDFEIGKTHNVMIVTGSNMAGKSTFLKAVATNVLLASCGGPVSARRLLWTPVSLYSDLNVRDSLDDGKSYFQVEVERVHEVIRNSAESPRILAIFDELFRGTNSDERLALCRAILRHLQRTGMLLIVATHDNLVTALVTEENEPGMANYHFEEQVADGKMSFDYRLRKGPARTRNAIRVLEITGYPQRIVAEARSEAGVEVES